MIQQKKKGILYKIRKHVLRYSRVKTQEVQRIPLGLKWLCVTVDIFIAAISLVTLICGVAFSTTGQDISDILMFCLLSCALILGTAPGLFSDTIPYRSALRVIARNTKLPVFVLPLATCIFVYMFWRIYV